MGGRCLGDTERPTSGAGVLLVEGPDVNAPLESLVWADDWSAATARVVKYNII